MKELFKPEEITKKSPRLLWMEKYNLETIYCPEATDIDDEEMGLFAWGCHEKDVFDGDLQGNGRTEDEAITDWAIKNKVKLWNEINL